MARGPHPKPTALKILEGVKPGRINQREPVITGTPEQPADLTVDAKVLWDQVAPAMIRSGVLTVADVPAFAELLEAMVLAKFYRAQMRLQLGGAPVANGQTPAVYQYARLHVVLNNGWAQFGMTPSARSRLIASVTSFTATEVTADATAGPVEQAILQDLKEQDGAAGVTGLGAIAVALARDMGARGPTAAGARQLTLIMSEIRRAAAKPDDELASFLTEMAAGQPS